MSGKWDLTAFAAQMTLTSARALTGTEWERVGITFLHDISRSCQEKDTIIGHIKGILKLDVSGYYYLSTVSADQEPNSQGESNSLSHKSSLDFNVLVYGIEREELRLIITHLVDKLSEGFSFSCVLQEFVPENEALIQLT